MHVRLPPDLYKQIAHSAIENDRSLNSEITHRLRLSYEATKRRRI